VRLVGGEALGFGVGISGCVVGVETGGGGVEGVVWEAGGKNQITELNWPAACSGPRT